MTEGNAKGKAMKEQGQRLALEKVLGKVRVCCKAFVTLTLLTVFYEMASAIDLLGVFVEKLKVKNLNEVVDLILGKWI